VKERLDELEARVAELESRWPPSRLAWGEWEARVEAGETLEVYVSRRGEPCLALHLTREGLVVGLGEGQPTLLTLGGAGSEDGLAVVSPDGSVGVRIGIDPLGGRLEIVGEGKQLVELRAGPPGGGIHVLDREGKRVGGLVAALGTGALLLQREGQPAIVVRAPADGSESLSTEVVPRPATEEVGPGEALE
jgi:hypothetical protein